MKNSDDDFEFVREKLKILDSLEVPESVAPKTLMAKLDRTPKKVFDFSVFKKAALAAAAIALFAVGTVTATQMQTNLPTQFGAVESQVESVSFFKSDRELLKAVSSCESGRMHLRLFSEKYSVDDVISDEATVAEQDYSANGIQATATEKNYSVTNNQTAGVYEADTAITDGSYIYTLNQADGKIEIVDVRDPSNMQKLSSVSVNSAWNTDFYVSGERLTLINSTNGQTDVEIYDISDRANPALFSKYSQDGSYNTSRLIGNTAYIISVKNNFAYHYGLDDILFDNFKSAIPCVSINGADRQRIPAQNICTVGEPKDAIFTVISAIDTSSGEPVNVMSVMGGTATVYCSRENLYLTCNVWSENSPQTQITEISLNGGNFTVSAQSEVNGRLLNQFSLDEYNSCLRVATTSHSIDEDGTYTENNVYILDKNLKTVGKLEGLARDERIYSARFMGDKIYLVTFRETDPLFAISVSDPTNPTVLGELKIPGVSNYLHPFGDNMLIGFGEDITVNEEFGTVQKKGLKLSLFDVSDLSAPKEAATLLLGSPSSSSEAQYNHKAILFEPSRSLFGFSMYDGGNCEYMVLQISEDGFEPIKRIVCDEKSYTARGLIIGDVLFTIDYSGISADALFDGSHFSDIDF